MRSLIVGDGYLAATLADQLRRSGVSVERTPRVGGQEVDQIVITPSTQGPFVDRVDGPRWLVCSWAGGAPDGRPLEDLVLERGGTVLRLAAVFGRNGDDNVSRIARRARRYRTLIGVGNGERLVQPLHVDDLAALVGLHLQRPSSGHFDIAGPEAVPVAEVCRSIVEILGVRPIGRGTRARTAIDWHEQPSPVDTHPAHARFGWSPVALGVRVEQAVHEALA